MFNDHFCDQSDKNDDYLIPPDRHFNQCPSSFVCLARLWILSLRRIVFFSMAIVNQGGLSFLIEIIILGIMSLAMSVIVCLILYVMESISWPVNYQLIDEPTYITEHSSSTLDLLIVNDHRNFVFSEVGAPLLNQTRYHWPIIGQYPATIVTHYQGKYERFHINNFCF
jgi:hypothetical protein